MSAEVYTGGLLSFADLEARWKPPGASARARYVWVKRRVDLLRLRAAIPGRGPSVRFSLAAVLAAEEKQQARRTCFA